MDFESMTCEQRESALNEALEPIACLLVAVRESCLAINDKHGLPTSFVFCVAAAYGVQQLADGDRDLLRFLLKEIEDISLNSPSPFAKKSHLSLVPKEG